uniref:RIP metalloprotease RseP n=1 Tax=Eubacterium cellulosolvens TaxID=29322 RepID=UPI0004868172|nr:RIP metalloprotease RseP [[Eubacterium] cellulosolvens]
MKYILGIIVLGLVVLFHEFGHFLLARLNHIVVEEFAIGMGPILLKHKSKKSGTVYALKLLPFGGSCAMLNEDEGEKIEGSFIGAALWRRMLVVAAGPVFNFILAFLLSVLVIGLTGAEPATVMEVGKGSPEEAAGLRRGDVITSFEGRGIANSRELYFDQLIKESPTDHIDLTVERNGKRISIGYQPETVTRYMLGFNYDSNTEGDGVLITMVSKGSAMKKAGIRIGDIITAVNGTEVKSQEELYNYFQKHPLDGSKVNITYERNGHEKTAKGLVPAKVTRPVSNFTYNAARQKVGWIGVLQYSAGEVLFWIRVTIKTIGGMFSGTFSINDMSGPVGIVKTVGDAYGTVAKTVDVFSAILTLIGIMTMISANLGFMNLIPLPALDGGRLLLMVIEAIRRKPGNQELEANINFYGLLALLAFMVYVTIHDLFRLF